MRLNNYMLFTEICSLGLSGSVLSDVKLLMCLGEKLKSTEQQLIFLKKCRNLRIFPVFIMNSFSFAETLFPVGLSSSSKDLLFRLRSQSLSQNITYKYHYIHQLKTDIHQIRTKLQTSVSQCS